MKYALCITSLFFIFLSSHGQIQRDISFVSDTLVLKGTLTIPKGEGPFPGMVFVHGSGPNDRNQKVVLNNTRSECLYPQLHGDTIQNFKELADILVENNIAVLRYDKRTFTYKENLNIKTINPKDFIQDIHSALNYLKAQDKIASGKLLLLGHSQGGNLIPLVARKRNDIAGLIALATPSESIDSVMARQVKYIFERCVDSTKGIIKSERILHVFEKMRNGNWPANKPLLNAYPQFWRDWLEITDSAVYYFKKTNVPTLFISGTEDYNVPPENLREFKASINRKNAEFKLLEGVNHFLTPMDSSHLSPKISKSILKWLEKEHIINGD